MHRPRLARPVPTHAPGTVLGYRDDGRPILPIAGGAPGDEDDDGQDDDADAQGADDDGQDDADDGTDDEGAEHLGDPGKQALDRQKEKWKAERERRKAAETELAELRAKHSPGAAAGTEPNADQIREQARTEARAEALRDRALDRLEAKAARLLTEPEDARRFLEHRVEDFIDDGKVDNDAIVDAIEELIKTKPYLAAATAKPRFEGRGDGGARNGPGKPRQLTETDLNSMTPEQIVAAQKAGQLKDLLGG
ncbi:hypothetical protein ACU686_40480 [Yinghuangia aomiensis]